LRHWSQWDWDGLDLPVHHRALVDDVVDEDAVVPEAVYLPLARRRTTRSPIPHSPASQAMSSCSGTPGRRCGQAAPDRARPPVTVAAQWRRTPSAVAVFVGVEERAAHSSPQPHVRPVGEEPQPRAGAFGGAGAADGRRRRRRGGWVCWRCSESRGRGWRVLRVRRYKRL